MSKVTINWFEIPVVKMERAVAFYQQVLGFALDTMDGPTGVMHVFPGEDGAAGALAFGDTEPGSGGVLVYLYCEDIDAALGRVEAAGGSIVQPRTSIGPFGFIGSLIDSEGNRVSLHNPG